MGGGTSLAHCTITSCSGMGFEGGGEKVLWWLVGRLDYNLFGFCFLIFLSVRG